MQSFEEKKKILEMIFKWSRVINILGINGYPHDRTQNIRRHGYIYIGVHLMWIKKGFLDYGKNKRSI